ncbi:MAG: FAD-dependent oxidoreductase [Candidatus Nanopelagicales bacterium]
MRPRRSQTAGASVVVLDKEPLGWGASSRNGGMVIPELKSSPAALVKKIGPLGAQLYAEVEQAFEHTEALTREIDCDYERSGQLYLAHSRHHTAELQGAQRPAARRAFPEPVSGA